MRSELFFFFFPSRDFDVSKSIVGQMPFVAVMVCINEYDLYLHLELTFCSHSTPRTLRKE